MTPDPKTEALKPCPKLEPCPLCGGISSWAFKRYANTGQLHGHKIRCESCGLEIESDVSFWTDGEEGRIFKLEQSRIELAIRWNTRAPAIERDAEVTALREALKDISELSTDEADCDDGIPNLAMKIMTKAEAALASTAGTDFAERLRRAEEERDEAHRELLIQAEQHKQATALMSESALKALAAVTAEQDEAVRRRDHTAQWYAQRWERLQTWARNEIPTQQRDEFFSILANGAKNWMEQPPSIVLQMNLLGHERDELKAKLTAAESARDALAKECAELRRMLNGQ